jgi:hypothetical protein
MIRTGRLRCLGHLSRMQELDTDPCRMLTLLKSEGMPLSLLLNQNRELYPGRTGWDVKLTSHQGYV